MVLANLSCNMIFTDHIQSTKEGNVFEGVCSPVHMGWGFVLSCPVLPGEGRGVCPVLVLPRGGRVWWVTCLSGWRRAGSPTDLARFYSTHPLPSVNRITHTSENIRVFHDKDLRRGLSDHLSEYV